MERPISSHSPSSVPPLLSVIVCTRDRVATLLLLLASLEEAAMAAPVDWELVVVDNGSRDDTARAVRAWGGRVRFPVNLVVQPKPGLAIARNAGLVAAKGSILAFTDDDCRVDRSWLASIAAALSAPDGPALVGGKVTLLDVNDFAVSIRDHDTIADIRSLGDIMTRLIGCNFAVRRSVIDRIGGFDERLGAGSPAVSAEDLDFFYRALKAGFQIVYDPTIALAHAHGRRDPGQLADLQRGYIVGRASFYMKHALRGDLGLARSLYWEIRAALSPSSNGVETTGPGPRACLAALVRGILLRLTGR